MVNTSTGPVATKPVRVIGVSQPQTVSPSLRRKQQELSDKTGVTTFGFKGGVSTVPSGSNTLQTTVNTRIIQEQQRANVANVAQSKRVALLNPAVRANLAKQGVTGNVGRIVVNTPSVNFGQSKSNQQIRQQLQDLESTKIKEPRFTFGGQQRFAGQSDQVIAQRLADVPAPTRAERGLQPLQRVEPRVSTPVPATQTGFIGPVQPSTIQPIQQVKSSGGGQFAGSLGGFSSGEGTREPTFSNFRQVEIQGRNTFVRDDPIVLASLGIGRSFANFGSSVGNIFTGISETFAGKPRSDPFVIDESIQGTPSRTFTEGLVSGVEQVIAEPRISSGVFAGLPKVSAFQSEVDKAILRAGEQFREEPALSFGDVLGTLSPLAIGGGPVTTLPRATIGTGGKSTIGGGTVKVLDPSLKRIRDLSLAGEGKTVINPETSVFGTISGTASRAVKPSKTGKVTTRTEDTAQVLQRDRFVKSPTENIKPAITEKQFERLTGQTGGTFTRTVTKTIKPAKASSAQNFRLFQERVAKLPKPPKTKGSTATKRRFRQDTLFGPALAVGTVSASALITGGGTLTPPAQAQQPRLDQTQRFSFDNPTRFPNPIRNVPILTPRQASDFIPTQGTALRGGSLFIPPAFNLFRGGGSADQPFSSQQDRKFFRVFDVSRKPFGPIKRFVGFQQQSFKPIKEIRVRRGTRKIAVRRPKNIILDKSFEKLFKI